MTRLARPVALGLAAALLIAPPAAADDIEEALQAALDAYRAGDVQLAQEETAFATQLLSQLKAESLSAFLPDALPGWTAEEPNLEANAMAQMFGGGQVAQRSYTGQGANLEITIMADNPMVASMGAMFANPAMMASAGKMKRIAGQKAVVDQGGDMMSLVGGRFLVQLSGSASEADKEAYFGAIDFAGLKSF